AVDWIRRSASDRIISRSRSADLGLFLFGFSSVAFPVLVDSFGHRPPGDGLGRFCSFLRGCCRLCERLPARDLVGPLYVVRPSWPGLVWLRLGSPAAGNRFSCHIPLPSA